MARTFIALVVIVALMAFVGWITFSNADGEPSVKINTEEIKQDTEKVVEQTKSLINDATEDVKDAVPAAE